MSPESDSPSNTANQSFLPRGVQAYQRIIGVLVTLVLALVISYVTVYTSLGPIPEGQSPNAFKPDILVFIFSVGMAVTIGTSSVLHLGHLLYPGSDFSLGQFFLSAALHVVVPLLFFLSVVLGLSLVTVAILTAETVFGIDPPLAVGSRLTYALITLFMAVFALGWGFVLGSGHGESAKPDLELS